MRSFLKTIAISTLSIAAFVANVPTHAQQQPGMALNAQQMQQLNALKQQGQQVQQRISQIQQKALANNPELTRQGDELDQKTIAAMKANGYDPEATMAKMKELQMEFRKPDNTNERKQDLQQAFQSKRAELQKAQQSVAGNQGLTSARNQLQTDMMAAMEKADPELPKLMEQLAQLRGQMQQIIANAQKGQ